nr:unnamed protein product [Spirometra erinaceieuropaei]
MLMNAYHDERSRISIDHRTDGHLLNSRRLKAPTHLSKTTFPDLLFADDCAFNNTTEEGVQWSLDISVSGCVHFAQPINADRTVIIHQQALTAGCSVPRIRVYGTELKPVDYFKYLGSAMSRCIRIDDGVAHRISKAS